MDEAKRKTLGCLAGGLAAAGLLAPGLALRAGAAEKAPAGNPKEVIDEKGQVVHQSLPYVQLDPDAAAERAYQNYWKGDCMYGVFASIVEELAAKVGEPYSSFPTTVTRFGAGGVMGWATLCGAANGAAMAAYLVSKDAVPVIDEVFGHYQAAPLPDYKPKAAKMAIKPSVAQSTLCHVSVSKWCDASGAKAFSPERSERCAQLVASVTRKAVAALNAQAAGTFKAAYPLPDEVKACRACHDKGGALENTRAKMDCFSCHTDHTKT